MCAAPELGWPGQAAALVVLLTLLPRGVGQASVGVAATLAPLPFEYAKDEKYADLINQGEAVRYFEERFYAQAAGQRKPSLSDDELRQVDNLRLSALNEPVLALAAAQVLYMFGWFRSTGQVLRENIAAAAALFERSIVASPCLPGQSEAGDWVENACDIRWMHACLLYNWLSETEGPTEQGMVYSQKAHELLRGMRAVPQYADISDAWSSPSMISFNSIIFKGKPSKPIWNTQKVGVGRWLEENHPIFRAELEAIVSDPRDLFRQLMLADPSREHLATPGGWDTLRIVRYHHWFDLFCEFAPQTCALIRSRPEINDCSFMNVNYVRLNPGAHLKPHYGNGPRLSGHLSVIAPEPLRAGMTVGNERTLWMEGKAVIFDDTFPHMVSHWGSQPRYVMLVWFCHPCDTKNPHGQECPTSATEL